MLKGIKVRLYPNKKQKDVLNQTLGSCRYVYNRLLSLKQEVYEESGDNISFAKMNKVFHNEYRVELDWLRLINTKVIKHSICNLDQAYTNFFKHGSGYPKFKAKRNIERCTFPKEAVSKTPFNKEMTSINLIKSLKNLRFKCSKEYKEYLTNNKLGIRSVSVTKEKDGTYYASILVEGDVRRKVDMDKPINSSVGVDLGIKTLAFYSNGDSDENPKYYKTEEKSLKRLHQNLSRKQSKSKNREKARVKLAKKYKKVKNRKLNCLHNITSKLIKENQIIILEDLSVKEMYNGSKSKGFNKAIQEVGFYEFKRQLGYKCSWYNRDLIIINKWFASSKTCSKCGCKNNNLTLSDRIFNCPNPNCKLSIDRDYNAALNIQREGIKRYHKLVGHRVPDFKPVDNHYSVDKLKSEFRIFENCNDWLKQEVNVVK
jgi:putative transposase